MWYLAYEVIDLFEQAKLKGQRLNLSMLLAKLEFKQQYFTPISHMDESEQCCLPTRLKFHQYLYELHRNSYVDLQVISGECSLTELKREAAGLKLMQALKTAFLHLTNTDMWEEAKERYPPFSNNEHMCKFMQIELNKSIPQPFAAFCMQAKLSLESSCTDDELSLLKYQNIVACIIDSKTTELSGPIITTKLSTFKGGNVSLLSLYVVCILLLCV